MRAAITRRASGQPREAGAKEVDPSKTLEFGFSWFGLRLCVAANFYSNAYDGELQRAFGLLRDEAAAIVCIAVRKSTAAQEIVRITGRPKNSISRAVRSLERKKLVLRIEYGNDRRSSKIDLTASGWKLYREIAALAADQDARMMHSLSDDEQYQFVHLLEKVRKSMRELA